MYVATRAGEFESLAAPGELPWPVETGHGLWLVRQIASHFAMRCDDSGVTATVAFHPDAMKPGE
jgi:hypothetical protein